MTKRIDPQSWKQDLPAFREKTDAFRAGEVDKNAYKGFSGFYGSYSQKGGKAHMLRLRMTAGRATKEKLAYAASAIRNHTVPRAHFTTCQTIQFHDLQPDSLYPIMEEALDAGIVTIGGGGDFPRNVMCSPLSGVEEGEYFDVMPYAEAAAEYAMHFVKAEKMPRKLKIAFSNSPSNVTHATFRDLGFTARPDGLFDVYSAGGLGNNPKLGVKVAEGVSPEKILYYIKAMWMTFRTYGNYENRGKARTRYMQEVCGGAEGYRKAYLEKLQEVFDSGEDLDVHAEAAVSDKTGNGTSVSGYRVLRQKQDGLYTVVWHPIGGQADTEVLCALSDLITDMKDVEMRLSPDETAYIINLTGDEAEKVLAVTDGNAAKTPFETSVACIGASTCQVGLRDSQALLNACIEAVREAGIPADALPQIHISGCPSSCGTHQSGVFGFRGAVKLVDKKPLSGFMLYLGGNDKQGQEVLGCEAGVMLEEDIPVFLTELGRACASSGKCFNDWYTQEAVKQIAQKYI